MIDDIMPAYFESCKLMGIEPEYDSVEMCATTNKAAEVVSQSTGRPSSTIHSFLGLKVKDDYRTGRSTLEKTTNWQVHERKILFIDEGSMIDTPLDGLVQEGTQGCKIVYVSDHCQLAPIMESISPIYRRPYRTFELTQPMRTQNVHLQTINGQLRETVKTGVFQPIQIVPGVIDHLDGTSAYAELDKHFAQQTHDARILAYTNRRVVEFNDYIRGIRQLPDAFTVGEFLVNNSAIELKLMNGASPDGQSGTRMLPVEAEVTIIHQDSAIENLPIDPKHNVFLKIRRSVLKSKLFTFKNVPIFQDRTHFNDLLKYYKQTKNWERFYFLKKTFPELRQHDAATCHKAQGSSYDTVFIDLSDISTCHQADQVARMLYVAVSRARSRIFLFGELAPKYGGLIH
jgi:exodeoxyribonuclease-5